MRKDRGVRPGAGICATVADRADHAEGVVTRYPPRRSARRMLRMMETGRREFLECLTAALVTVIPVAAGPRGANSMYGLIVKITAAPGKRDEFIAILKESAADMPGCLSYIVASDPTDENSIWVTEVWDSVANHDASLSIPSVQGAMVRAKPMVGAFAKVGATTPIWGVGLRAAHAR